MKERKKWRTRLVLHSRDTEWFRPLELRKERWTDHQEDIERIAILNLEERLDIDSRLFTGDAGEGWGGGRVSWEQKWYVGTRHSLDSSFLSASS